MEFCPGIYEHAAGRIGRTPWEVSRSAELLFAAHRAAWELYQQRIIVVGIDVYNLEPEAFGSVIPQPPGYAVPAITRHAVDNLEDLRNLELPDPDASPRILATLEAGQQLQAACRGAEVRIPICGPLALANGLSGMEPLLIGLMDDPEAAMQGIQHVLNFQYAFLKSIQRAGLRPMIFESGVTPPLLSTGLFASVEAPLLASAFDRCESLFGERPSCIIGGNSAPIAKGLLDTGPGYVIAPSETDQTAFLAIANAFPRVHVRVNMDARVLVKPDFGSAQSELTRVMAIAASRPNTSVGCGVVPYDADPAVIIRLRDLSLASAFPRLT